MIYSSTPLAAFMTIRHHKRASGVMRYFGLLLLALTIAQLVFIFGLSALGTYYDGWAFWTSAFAIGR